MRLLNDLSEIEIKIKQVEQVLKEQRIPLDEEFILKIIKEHTNS
tara:strand:+ start:19834 stop:19965 length:132 start_codon:yes stop_codon:yes gene_type:complete